MATLVAAHEARYEVCEVFGDLDLCNARVQEAVNAMQIALAAAAQATKSATQRAAESREVIIANAAAIAGFNHKNAAGGRNG